MSNNNVVGINNKLEAATKPNIDACVLDTTGSLMVVGNKYEMYAPIAKLSEGGIGLCFADNVGYSFTYAGTLVMGDTEYLASPDVTYPNEDVSKLSPALAHLLTGEGVAHPLCPTYIAAKFIRPATDE